MKVKNHAEVSPYTQYINTSEPLMTSPISAFLSSYISDDALVTGKLIISTYLYLLQYNIPISYQYQSSSHMYAPT